MKYFKLISLNMHADLTEAKKYTSQNEARGSRTKSWAHIVDLVK